MLSKVLCLALMATSAFAATEHVGMKRGVAVGPNIPKVAAKAAADMKALRKQVVNIVIYAKPANATAVGKALVPVLKKVGPVLIELKVQLALKVAVTLPKRDLEEHHLESRQVNNAAVAASVASIIADLALLIASVELLIFNIPVLSALLTPILLALNPLLAAVLVLLNQLLSGVLVIVANLLQNLLGPAGLINLIPLLSGLGSTLSLLITRLLAGI